MCERFAKIWTIVVLLIAIILLQGDIIPSPFSPRRGGNSPCECLTGVFADNAIRTALRRESLFIGIHWREARSRIFPFFDPWSLKYDNCLTLHELYIPFYTIELNGTDGKMKMKDWNTSVLEEALYRQIENDITNNGSSNSKSNILTMRDSGLFAIQRVWWRRRGRISSSSVYGGTPSCHVWILPETTDMPLEVWMALRRLLENGTLAGKSIHFSSESTNNNNNDNKKKRELWSSYQPLGVLLWADSNDRKSLKRMLPDFTITMFTTIRQ
ncbi:hypothetical protein LSM04_005863 [Trypanosoma melophagium]|uniref:uncharacterized protein n=1 Tax=Trypanosoma melophagium TaxID=715481 RepID=UPI00351A2BFB|nr:hypothetical protein LSM04_005863 [Trypanosoma melophagium]